jgi:magnesium-transporting ATPase (P-type)
MLLGHWLEMRAIGQARSALAALAELLPDEAERIREDGAVETVRIADLAEGDLVLVRPGGRVPADGSIAEGEATNLWWAAGYNIVALNAQLLRRTDLAPASLVATS